MLYPGQFLRPPEIHMLSRVCRAICQDNGISPESPQAQRTASHLMKMFMNGLTREEELLDASRNRLARRKQPLEQTLLLRHLGDDSQTQVG
ncbi:hypothetical protein FJW06_17290 [Mesorhizobium sp. B4-1-3]|nr:hypothetical protein FJW06_17290 [Mesorhizobium sp. B4-1-3]